MKNILSISILSLFFCTNIVSSQTATITNVSVNGTPISNCGTIAFGTNSTVTITYTMKVTKGSTVNVDAFAKFNVYIKLSSSSTPLFLDGLIVNNSAYTNGTVWEGTFSKVLQASDIAVSGSVFYGQYDYSSSSNSKTCEYALDKAAPPSFSFSPTSLGLACGDTASRIFTITPINIPSGANVTYQWSYSGWSLINSTATSQTLAPSSGTYLPSNISVTPYINGAAYPSKTCTVSLSSFSSFATINGSSSICNLTEIYSIANLAAGQNLNWSSSNTAIATVNNTTGNTVTVNKVGTGDFDLIATISNSCGQIINVSKPIIAYAITSLPTPSGSFDVDFIDCYNDTALPINFYPDTPFGGVITYTPSVLPHPLQSQTKTITVKYTNPCTGAYTSNVIKFYYQAPDCSSAKMTNNISLYNIYPNPSNDIINIDLKDENNLPTKEATIFGELFDMSGQSKSKVKISDNKATFSVKGLKKGIYILKIYIDDHVESHHIAVE